MGPSEVGRVLWWRARGAQRATRGPYASLSLALDAAPASGQYRIDTPNREAASYAIARTIAVIEAGGEAVCRMSVRLGKRRSKASVVPVAQSVVPLAHSAITYAYVANALSLSSSQGFTIDIGQGSRGSPPLKKKNSIPDSV